jgi:hypothetical protein
MLLVSLTSEIFWWFVCVKKREASALTVVFLSRSGTPSPIVSCTSGRKHALSGLEWVMYACKANVRRTSAPTRTTQSCVVRLLSITLMLVSSTFLLSSNSSLARHSQVSFSGSGRVFRLSSHFAILYFFSFSFLF